MSFWGELRRRNVFKVAAAYLVASWLVVQVVGVLTDPLNLPGNLDAAVVVLLAIGFPVALVIAWIYEVTPEGIRVTSQADAEVRAGSPSGQRLTYVVIGLLVIAVGLLAVDSYIVRSSSFNKESAERRRMAILPCTDLSPDPTNSFFADGIHTELIQRLGSLGGLDVISQTSVQQYADGRTPILQVAEELAVHAVMECFARYAGNQVLLMTQLIDGETDGDLWSASYRADMSDPASLFDIQTNIATNVANALAVELSLEERQAIDRAPTESAEAYALYLRGLNVVSTDRAAGMRYLEQALEIDPDFALAHGALAVAFAGSIVNTSSQDAVDAEERVARMASARQHAQRAIDLDPSLGTSHAVIGRLDYYSWRWADALSAFQQAPQTNLVYENVVFDYVWLNSYLLKHQEAISIARGAVELNPKDWLARWALGSALAYSGELDEAQQVLHEAVSLAPAIPQTHIWLGFIEISLGDTEAALSQLELTEQLMNNRTLASIGELAYAYSRVGRNEDALRIFNEIERRAGNRDIGAGTWAVAYLAVGDKARALESLGAATEKVNAQEVDAGFYNLMNLRMNVTFDPVLEQPEFVAVRDELRGK